MVVQAGGFHLGFARVDAVAVEGLVEREIQGDEAEAQKT